jgi:hypothetical protein
MRLTKIILIIICCFIIPVILLLQNNNRLTDENKALKESIKRSPEIIAESDTLEVILPEGFSKRRYIVRQSDSSQKQLKVFITYNR